MDNGKWVIEVYSTLTNRWLRSKIQEMDWYSFQEACHVLKARLHPEHIPQYRVRDLTTETVIPAQMLD